MKKIISSLIAIVLITSTTFAEGLSPETLSAPSYQASQVVSSFPDVTSTDWYYNTVTKMAQKGLFKGYDDGEFKPDNTMTRAEFIACFFILPLN